MSIQRLGYIQLDMIVNDYILEANKSVNDYYRLWHLAYRGMDDLGVDAFYTIKTAKIPVNSNYTATIPEGFIQWTKVGILNSKGEIMPLKRNDSLTSFADLWSNRTTVAKGTDDIFPDSDSDIYNTWNWNSYGYVNIYGVPSGLPTLGEFKFDISNGIILLNQDYAYDYIMLEYVSSPKVESDYYVPMVFREALIAWLRWKDIESIPAKTHAENSNVVIRMRSYYNARRTAIARWKPIRIEEMYQASQEQTRMAIKS